MRAPRWLYPVRTNQHNQDTEISVSKMPDVAHHPLAWLRDRGYVITRDGVVRGRLAGSAVILIDDIASYIKDWAGWLSRMLRWPLRRMGVLTGSDTQILIRMLAGDLRDSEALNKKVDLVVETMAQMVEAAGLSESFTEIGNLSESCKAGDRASLIKRIEELEWRCDAQDDAWTAWRESRGGKS